MYKLGESSHKKIMTCDTDIQKICFELIESMDYTVIWGHRGKVEQDKAYLDGNSTKKYPESKHNIYPSLAIDIAPYFPAKPHIRWVDEYAFILLAGKFLGIAHMLGINARWGGCWANDNDVTYNKKHKLHDLGHFEIIPQYFAGARERRD